MDDKVTVVGAVGRYPRKLLEMPLEILLMIIGMALSDGEGYATHIKYRLSRVCSAFRVCCNDVVSHKYKHNDKTRHYKPDLPAFCTEDSAEVSSVLPVDFPFGLATLSPSSSILTRTTTH